MTNPLRLGLVALFASAFVACATTANHPNHPKDPSTGLVAVSNVRVKYLPPDALQLDWNEVPGAEGYIVEYTANLQDPYVPIGLFPPGTTQFIHPDVIPDSEFYYRVLAYFGRYSQTVKIHSPDAAATQAAADAELKKAATRPH